MNLIFTNLNIFENMTVYNC